MSAEIFKAFDGIVTRQRASYAFIHRTPGNGNRWVCVQLGVGGTVLLTGFDLQFTICKHIARQGLRLVSYGNTDWTASVMRLGSPAGMIGGMI